MTTTPLPPTKHDHPDVHTMIWTQSELVWIQNRDAQWQAYATQARADLEAENANLRLELQSARDINLAVVNRQQAEIEALRKKLAQAQQDEADAVRAADAVYEAQERAADAYRAGSSGY